MKGTEKQIKWAEEIRDKIETSLPDMSASPIADKAKQYLLNLDEAAFWIDHRDRTAMDLLRDLIGGGLAIRGFQFSHRAKMDQTTGIITITWNEIVQDGHGGHIVVREQKL